MTAFSGSITLEAGKLERAIAEMVTREVSAAVAPVLTEVRRLAALAEAQIVGAPEAAKILVTAGATLDVAEAQGIVESLARIGYRLTLVDPEAVTAELPIVTPREEGRATGSIPWTAGAPHPELCSCVTCSIARDPYDPPAAGQDKSWTEKFE